MNDKNEHGLFPTLNNDDENCIKIPLEVWVNDFWELFSMGGYLTLFVTS